MQTSGYDVVSFCLDVTVACDTGMKNLAGDLYEF